MNIAERLSRAVPDSYLEPRPQQNEMAQEVAATLDQGGFLMAEAGTGVGKSFAYLLPAFDHVLKKGEPVVISTHTLTLQDQLFQKDVPFVQMALEKEGAGHPSAILLKGRGNYLSRRRLSMALGEGGQMALDGSQETLNRLRDWSERTFEGTWATVDFPIPQDIWNEVKSDPYHCMGAQCPTFETCFYHSTRKKAYGAKVILVNHALLLADLALKMEEDQGVLPPYGALIVDEAHHLPALASEHLATSFTLSECHGLVRRLLFTDARSEKALKGIFTLMPITGAGEAVMEFKAVADSFFSQVALATFPPRSLNRAYPMPNNMPGIETLAVPLRKVTALLETIEKTAPSEEWALEARGTREECRALLKRLSLILERGWGDDSCYVVEPDSAALRRGEIKAAALKAIPLDASSLLREHLLSSVPSVVFTSATLSVGNDFSYFKHALGLEEMGDRVKTLLVGSPFDFKKQVTLFLPRKMPHPRREEERYIEAVVEYVRASLRISHGKAFVLFTSFKMLRRVAEAVAPDLEELGIQLLVQGEEGWDRNRLLKTFREDVDSVLFGVNSFWEGVDVPGEALSNLIITKLPFQVPEGPLVEARHARMKEMGLEPFRVESLPEAVLRLKQGFGRLIRSSKDVGTVTLLDPRLTTERWGSIFLKALPECETVFLSGPGTPERSAKTRGRRG
ncbi:MAG TPA: helicase C-terminal domain-containing protein [bacterium]|nr:helicase C-terminal domain-containing protein [bacterium]